MPTRRTLPASTEAPVTTPAVEVFTMQPLGLTVAGNPTYEQWEGYGQRLFNVLKAAQWALGDWLNYGENRQDWGEMWAQALNGTQKSEDSMMSAMNVCRKFPVDRRRLTLSFGHHREVAPLPELDQDRFLDLAEQNDWSIRDLREAIKAERLLAAPPVATNEDGHEIHAPDTTVEWPQHVASRVSVYHHQNTGHIAVMTHLVFDGNVPNLPRPWQQLSDTIARRERQLNDLGYTFVSGHDTWRTPSHRVLAIEFDTASNRVTDIDPDEA